MHTEQHQAGGVGFFLLQNIPLFEGLSAQQLEQISRMAIRRKVARNATIVRAGDTTESLYVIVKGSAKVLNRDTGVLLGYEIAYRMK